ncbi:MAG: PAS domain S-box protein [Chitinivibrionales bacterium]|nr:PAS domain S-box protein [Chitinivibrionales bacterium]MBD3396710.1 PAS domain S-box protein [Chitinivibrionales bacterium]
MQLKRFVGKPFLVAAGGHAIYLLLILLLHTHAGMSVIIFSFVPGIAVALAYGIRVALIHAVLLVLVENSLVLYVAGVDPFTAFISAGNLAGICALLIMSGVVGYLHDLRVHLRAALKRSTENEQKLAESEKDFRAMFNLSSEGLFLVDLETGLFIAVNKAMRDLFGYTEDAMLTLGPIDLTAADVRDNPRASYQMVREGKEVVNVETVPIRRDGTQFNALVSILPFTWRGTKVAYGSMRNVTLLKEYQEQLQKKNREILDFTNMVTHDLKNPLAGLKGVCRMMQTNAAVNADEDLRETIALGGETLDYMQALLNDLLDVSRLEAGTGKLERERVNVQDIVDKAVARITLGTRDNPPRVESDVNIEVQADPAALSKVFMNLVGNAADYMGDRPDPKITIGVSSHNGRPEFFVRDNGVGIPPENLEMIFDKFKRGDNVKTTTKGTGLGLAITKGIVEAHGGAIRVESEVGAGSTFSFTLS